ncbi:unnamed protein product [Didymodactylos carnosus]|uniref:Uncharacterized protein n=1 Tax=Didymodactylos carnosus TaxID=1234261 RepID=A0A8S2E7X9_9BILA|nr:unnamed protein product [Didymodactylos carnosus]CAF3922423.1 unnamed protein product [Didymodactylos carnosus]
MVIAACKARGSLIYRKFTPRPPRLNSRMDEQIRIALASAKEQYRKGLSLRKEVRRVQDSRPEAKEEGQQQALVTTSITNEEYLKSNHEIIRNDVLDVDINITQERFILIYE